MNKKSAFTVNVPIEVVETWIKKDGVENKFVLEHQEILIDTLNYNKDTGYVEFAGDLISRQDA